MSKHEWASYSNVHQLLLMNGGVIFGGAIRDTILHKFHATEFYKQRDEYLEKNQANIMRGDLAGKLRQRLGEYAKVERNIKARPASEMSSSEKRKALEDLRQSKIQESKNYMQAFRIGA